MKTIEILDNENGRKWVINKIDDDTYSLNYYEYFKGLGWTTYKNKPEMCHKSYIEYEFDIDLSQPQLIYYI